MTHHDTRLSRRATLAGMAGLVIGVYLRLLPVGGYGGGSLRNLVLPTVALALPPVAMIARLTRASMIEVLRSNYIRTARAKACPRASSFFAMRCAPRSCRSCPISGLPSPASLQAPW